MQQSKQTVLTISLTSLSIFDFCQGIFLKVMAYDEAVKKTLARGEYYPWGYSGVITWPLSTLLMNNRMT